LWTCAFEHVDFARGTGMSSFFLTFTIKFH
jgi:hypothetical protein